MHSYSPEARAAVESGDEDRGGYDEEEGYYGNDTVAFD